jgi:hypothetical protein
MNFKSKGLLVSIVILISMMLMCHIANYLYSKNKNLNSFSNLALSTPNNTLPIEYNKIYYDYSGKNKKLDCKVKKEAEIPCNIVAACPIPTPKPTPTPTPSQIPTTTRYQLSDSEMALLYRNTYQDAGRVLLLRTLNAK